LVALNLRDDGWVAVNSLNRCSRRHPAVRAAAGHAVCPIATAWPGIIYMTRASIPWEVLPAPELGCASYATCWRRFSDWAEAGVFETLHLVMLDRLGEQGRVDWSRLLVDSVSLWCPPNRVNFTTRAESWPVRWSALRCCGTWNGSRGAAVVLPSDSMPGHG
jgi:transposase